MLGASRALHAVSAPNVAPGHSFHAGVHGPARRTRVRDTSSMFDTRLPSMPAWGVPATVVVLVTVAFLVLVVPFRGLQSHRRLAASRETDPTALTRFYRRNVAL